MLNTLVSLVFLIMIKLNALMHFFSSYTHTNCRSQNKRGEIHLTLKEKKRCFNFDGMLYIAQCQSESEGVAQERGLFTNSHKSLATCATTIIYPT